MAISSTSDPLGLSPPGAGGPRREAPAEHLSIVVVGHVDHGKSTLLGRLYADTGSLPDGKLERVQAICRQQGKEFEYAFLFDAFLEEQEQGVTIDTARTFFTWRDREYVIIDAPGHKEFLKNMVSGAARAEAALLVIDAHEGVQEQSRKHGYLLSFLGVRQVAVVVNKMDLVDYDQQAFERVTAEYGQFLAQLHVAPAAFIPVSAKLGDNVAHPSASMAWYDGPTALDALSGFQKLAPPQDQALRIPIQDVYKFDARRVIAGRVASGQLQVGDKILFSPSNKSARVKSIEAFSVPTLPISMGAGRSVGFTLDEQIFVERGEVASHEAAAPLVATAFRCNLFSMGTNPLEPGKRYLMRLATREVACEIAMIHRIVDADDLDARQTRDRVGRNEVAELTIHARAPLAIDLYSDVEVTGRFVLVDGHDVCAGGIITEVVADEHASIREAARRRARTWRRGDVGPDHRADRYGHRAAVVLIGGPDPARTLALARLVENRLIAEGRHAYLLQVENLASGPHGSRPAARAEALTRQLADVARFLTDAGNIVIAPAHDDRWVDPETVEAVAHPAPVMVVHFGALDQDRAAHVDLVIEEVEDLARAGDRMIESLQAAEIVLPRTDDTGRIHPPTYSI